MHSFSVPPDVIFGNGSLAELKHVPGKRGVLCVGTLSREEEQTVEIVRLTLLQGGMDVHLHRGVNLRMDPLTMARRTDVLQKTRPDWIIAVGDEEVIDSAKVLWIRYEHPELNLRQIRRVYSLPPMRKKARFCAVPTSLGAVNAMTAFASAMDSPDRRILPLADRGLVPDRALFDPSLIRSAPEEVALDGFSLLSAAVEAYLSVGHQDFSDTHALRALSLIGSNFLHAVGGNTLAREQMLRACVFSGGAFSAAPGGLTQSLAHVLAFPEGGREERIPHGILCAIALPRVLSFNGENPEVQERCCDIARAMGHRDVPAEESVTVVSELVEEFRRDLSLPEDVAEYRRRTGTETAAEKQGPSQTTYDRLVDAVLSDPFLSTNPRLPSKADVEELVRDCLGDRTRKYRIQ